MEKKSRVVNSAKNIAGNFLSDFICTILRFISRTVFIKTIGEFYLGVNGLFSNVLGILSLAELGITTAINYSLYKPLAENNEEKILALMKFYRTAFRVIALVILILGLGIFPFLDVIIKDNPGYEHLNLIYLIFLLNMVLSYLFSYRRTLANADQKAYKIYTCTMVATLITTIIQILILIFTRNYIAYLLIQTAFVIIENAIVNYVLNKEYPILKQVKTTKAKLDKEELGVIKKNVKALFIHRVGDTCVTSTDNIIISAFISVGLVGIYSNYLMIITMIKTLILVVFNNMTASFGNLIAEGDNEKTYNIFKSINFLSFVIYFIATICFLNLFDPFIIFWVGKEWLLPAGAVLMLVINFYFAGMGISVLTIKQAAGLYNEDIIDPFLQAILNITVSIILAQKIGITGVFIGTFVSYIVPVAHRSQIIYKKIFNKSAWNYFWLYLKQVIVVIPTAFLAHLLVKTAGLGSSFIDIIINLVISVLVPTLVIIILYHKSEEMNKLKEFLKVLVNKILHRKSNA